MKNKFLLSWLFTSLVLSINCIAQAKNPPSLPKANVVTEKPKHFDTIIDSAHFKAYAPFWPFERIHFNENLLLGGYDIAKLDLADGDQDTRFLSADEKNICRATLAGNQDELKKCEAKYQVFDRYLIMFQFNVPALLDPKHQTYQFYRVAGTLEYSNKESEFLINDIKNRTEEGKRYSNLYIASIYPINENLDGTLKVTDSLKSTLAPQYNGAQPLSLEYNKGKELNYKLQFPRVVGVHANETLINNKANTKNNIPRNYNTTNIGNNQDYIIKPRVSWTFYPQKAQPILLGDKYGFAEIKVPTRLPAYLGIPSPDNRILGMRWTVTEKVNRKIMGFLPWYQPYHSFTVLSTIDLDQALISSNYVATKNLKFKQQSVSPNVNVPEGDNNITIAGPNQTIIYNNKRKNCLQAKDTDLEHQVSDNGTCSEYEEFNDHITWSLSPKSSIDKLISRHAFELDDSIKALLYNLNGEASKAYSIIHPESNSGKAESTISDDSGDSVGAPTASAKNQSPQKQNNPQKENKPQKQSNPQKLRKLQKQHCLYRQKGAR